jgi:TolA-binding protein
MRARGLGPLLVAALALTSVSCATLFERPATEEERSAYTRARHAAEAARSEEDARDAYERFLEQFPNSALASDASLALGAIAQREGDIALARRHYE